MTRIVLEHVTKSFSGQTSPVLPGLSLDVQSGELLALLGPSGGGKSTLLKLIAGIEQPDSGDIRFDDRSLLPVPPNRRGAVLMFQKAYLFPFMTVADNIGFGLKMQGISKRQIAVEVARMLELVELPGSERKSPGQLSGGQQQRVALARALVVKPRVLLLDEPLSNLDPTIRQTLQQVIRRIQRELGVTTMLVTHDLSEALVMSDRTALLIDGTIAACDRPQQLFQRPPTRAAAHFVGISTFLEGRIEGSSFHSPYGAFTLPTAAKSRPATLAIRPEHVRLLSTSAPNAVHGVISEVSYRGEAVEYEVIVQDAQLRVRSFDVQSVLQLGAAAHVQFPPEHLFEVT